MYLNWNSSNVRVRKMKTWFLYDYFMTSFCINSKYLKKKPILQITQDFKFEVLVFVNTVTSKSHLHVIFFS